MRREDLYLLDIVEAAEMTEAIKTGFYETLYGKYPRVQILTIAELFAGKQPNVLTDCAGLDYFSFLTESRRIRALFLLKIPLNVRPGPFDGRHPRSHACVVVGGRKNGNLSSLYMLSVHLFHIGIGCHEQPSVLRAEIYNGSIGDSLQAFPVLPWETILESPHVETLCQ